MGCFLGCFGSSKPKKHNRNNVLQRDANSSKPQQYNVPLVQDHSKTLLSPSLESPQPQDKTEEEFGFCRDKTEEEVSVTVRKKVTFDSNVKTYESVLPEEGGKEEALAEPNHSKSSSCEDSSSVTSTSTGSYPPNHRYQNCRDSDDEEEEVLDDWGSDLSDDDDDEEEDGIREEGDELVQLKTLTHPMEGLKVSKSNLVVYIHPSQSNQVSKAVLRELSTLLFTYDEIFDGVVLAYDVDSLDKCAKVLPGVYPYFGVNLKVNMLLFSPKPDMLIEGKVEKVTPEVIIVIVLGFATAIITEKDIRGEFKFTLKHGVFASKYHKRHVIKKGTMLRFSVKSFDEEQLYVYGSLVPDNTGNIQWLDKNSEVVSHTDRSTKKRENEGKPLMSDKDALELSTVDTAKKLKMSKKQKVREES